MYSPPRRGKIFAGWVGKRSDVEIVRINDGESFFDMHQLPTAVDGLFECCTSYSRGLYISRTFEAHRILVVNSSLVAERCGDK
jgi:glutathione synthase/RimK-type ligase-like ATP-grasp enzyme